MQADAAPVAGREQRHVDLREVRGTRGVIFVAQLPALRLANGVGAVACEFVLAERFGAGNPLAGDPAFDPTLANAVLHADDLARKPGMQEVRKDAAMAA